MNAAGWSQIGRIVRLVGLTLFSSAVFVNLTNVWAVRYPMIGLAVGVLEAMYRAAVPTAPAQPAVPPPSGAPESKP